MGKFARGLKQAFIDRLNAEFARPGSWWRRIMDDPDLYVAIRGDYLNVYYRGASLLHLRLVRGRLVGKTHFKYLLAEQPKSRQYVPSEDGKLVLARGGTPPADRYLITDLARIREIKGAALRYLGDEKKGVAQILRANPNIIDVEIAIPGTGRNDRIDFVALQDAGGGEIEIVFIEAKLYADGRLRPSGGRDPEVQDQVERYRRKIAAQAADIVASYQVVCDNLAKLDGIPVARKKYARLALQAAAGLRVRPEPRLVIYGFDNDQKKGELKHTLLPDLCSRGLDLRAKGDPNDFTNGIGFC